MGWTNPWRERLRTLARRDAVEREMDEEMAFHLEMEVEKNLRADMAPEEARRRAMIAFGHAEKHREEVRDARWARPLLELTPDVKLALRMLVKHPALSLVGGLGMAVAIAVAAGFYTFMAAFYFSVPPLEEGDRIVALDNAHLMNGDDSRATLFDYHAWRTGLRTVRDVAAFTRARSTLEVPGAAPRPVNVAEMTASGFRLARVAPLLGRPIVDEDEREGASPVLVIGHDEWRRDFAADAGVIGREVRLQGTVHTVVGVMPEGFRFPSNHGYWTALRTEGAVLGAPGEGPQHLVFARIAAGMDTRAVRAEAVALHRRLAAEHPDAYEERRPMVGPYARALFDLQHYPPLLVFAMQLFAVLVLTLIAVNVAVLVYARTASRRAELTVRTALGASRRRIVTQLFIEALALSALAAGLGLLIAQLGLSLMFGIPDFADHVPYWIPRTLPPSTILYTAGLAILAAFVVGAVPGLQATGRHLQASLRQMGGGTGMRMGTTWTGLIVVQVAIAVAVLPAVLGIAWNTVWAPPPEATFPAGEVLVVGLRAGPAPPVGPAPEAERRERDVAYAAAQAELVRRLEAEPDVASVTYRASWAEPLPVAGEPDGGTTNVGSVGVAVGYFEVLGLRLLAGRPFERSDVSEAHTSAVVNRTFAEELFGSTDAVGRRVWAATDGAPRRSYEVVGVVEDAYVRGRGQSPERATMYLPAVIGAGELAIHARVQRAAPLTLLPRARGIAQAVAPGHEFFGSPLDARPRADRDGAAFLSLVVGLITLSVLALSAAGVSAMMSFAVTRRQREIGIRSALGAPRGRILWAIFARSARQIALGLVAGAAGALILDRLTGGGMLGGQESVLPPLVAAMMVLAALLATLAPARRAMRIKPMEALRLE